jgi:hypothetical protein
MNINTGSLTPGYAVTGWRKAFIRIVHGEHLKTRLNVLEPGCARGFGSLNLSIFVELPNMHLDECV